MNHGGLRICIDVPDMERAVRFYTALLGMRVDLRFGDDFVCLGGGAAPVDLLLKPQGTRAIPHATVQRGYDRHWCPIHLDVMVDDVDEAVQRAIALGAVVEVPATDRPYGRIAQLADPFGHGICLLSLNERGYAGVANP